MLSLHHPRLHRTLYLTATMWMTVACTTPESQTCPSGIVCPVGSTCAANGEVCIYDDCGDGKLQSEELCDDGNKTNGDGCSRDCDSIEVCGDNVLTEAIGEVCDDGNTTDGDGCSSDCRSREECGNGVVDSNEVCDDGNRESGDGCRDDCKSNEECGNGVVDFHLDEKCDPGLTRDECNDDCTSNLSCGNNFVDPDEQCDDGNNGDNTDDCITTDGAACRTAYCGDGFVRKNPEDPADLEECDDFEETEDCNVNCTAVKPIVTGSPDGCGDGIINATIGETCDDGARNGQHGYCSSQCNSPLSCGDGILTLPEVCDSAVTSSVFDSQGNVVACRADCNGYESYCGDGQVTEGEACDNGESNDDETYDGCRTNCTRGSRCGDGSLDMSEQCDDGDDNSPDPGWQQSIDIAECSLTCRWGPYCGDGNLQRPDEACEIWPAPQTFTVATITGVRTASCYDDCQGYCGDGKHHEDMEGCDLGGITFDEAGDPSGNGADADYGVPDHAITSCRADCTKCGDGVVHNGAQGTVDHSEGCDEGEDNVASAYDESGWSCNFACQVNLYCGDGLPGGEEQCDNGSENGSADGDCAADCKFKPYCGDDHQDAGETCDDGEDNVTPGYGTPGCNTNCHVNKFCGDGGEPDWGNGEACDWAGNNRTPGEYNSEARCNRNCQFNPHCGDGSCANGETSESCSADCPPPPD